MAIGAMMNVPPSEIGDLSWHDFQSMCWHYNQLNSPEEDEPKNISAEQYQAHLDRMASRGELRMT